MFAFFFFKILKLDQHKGDSLVYMYLFVGADSQELDKSINYQLAQSELWQKLTTQNNNNTITSSNGSSVDTGKNEQEIRHKVISKLFHRVKSNYWDTEPAFVVLGCVFKHMGWRCVLSFKSRMFFM